MADKIWQKRYLIPVWLIQLIGSAILVVAAAFSLTLVSRAENNGDFEGQRVGAALNVFNTVAGVLMAFAIATIICDITEMVLIKLRKLKPVANIVIQSVKTLLWAVYMILGIVGAATTGGSSISIILGIVVFLACLGQLIYGGVILHRYRKETLHRGRYSPTAAGGEEAGFSQSATWTAYNPHNGLPPEISMAQYDQSHEMQQSGGRRY